MRQRIIFFQVLSLFLFGVSILGCEEDNDALDSQDSESGDIENEAENLFLPEELLEIEIEMAEDDWDNLRFEGRPMPRVYAGCFEFSGYTYFDSTVTINNETVKHVSVRKKGFLGSLSMFRPSFKINFGLGEAYQDRLFHGEKRFTLNNNKQDLSNVRQCLSYSLFTKAGIKAPRCNFAHVTAQGEDLGIYSHVEAIKKPFLARAFGDDSGNLYEGQVSDFNSGLSSTFQMKTNERENDRSDIEAVVSALQQFDDAEIWDGLNEVIDMDEFLTYWALEVLVGHWDSYSGNQNNFYMYNDPSDGRFHFIPWGTDGAFMSQHPEQFGVIPKSTYAASELTARLWNIPETRSRYEKRLQKLMDELWDESALNAEVDRIGELTGTPEEQLDIIKQFIDERQEVIESELEGTAPAWPEEPMNVEIVCMDIPSTSGTFDLTWSDTYSYTPDGKITFDISIAGQPLVISNGLVSAAGPIQEIDDSLFGTPRIAFVGTDDTSGREIWVGLYIPESEWSKGEIAFHGYEIFGIIIEPLPDGSYRRLGLIGDGTITMEKAGHTNGAAVKGSWEGTVVTVF